MRRMLVLGLVAVATAACAEVTDRTFDIRSAQRFNRELPDRLKADGLSDYNVSSSESLERVTITIHNSRTNTCATVKDAIHKVGVPKGMTVSCSHEKMADGRTSHAWTHFEAFD